jgi:cardiolipin synthase A/B
MRHIRGRRLLVTVTLTVLATLGASVLYFNARPIPKRVTSHVENAYNVDDPGFRRTMTALIGTPIVAGNSIEWLRDGEAIFAAKLAAIAAAEHSVTLEVFEFYGERVAPLFADALAERARHGVPVHVILDYVGASDADPELFEQMKAAGVELEMWREPSWYQSARFNHRTHRKLLVVDGTVGFTGGANLADPWLAEDPRQSYRDNHYRFEGPIVAHLQAAFMDNWLFATGRVLLGDRYFPPLEAAGNIEAQVVISSPREGYKRIRTLLLLAFASAQQNIRIATAYFYADPMLEDALIAARERGVAVDILAPGPKIEKPWVRHASRNRWGRLLHHGVRIHEYKRSHFHAKMFVIDDQWVSIGSANFDNRSFRLNDETNVNIFDAGFARRMVAVFEDDLAEATLYDLKRWQARPWTERAHGVLGNLVGPHL